MTPEKYVDMFFNKFAPQRVGGGDMYNYLLKRFRGLTRPRYRADFVRGKEFGVRLGIKQGRKEVLEELRAGTNRSRQAYLCGYNDCKNGRKL